jgi:hypothetical protein
MVEFTHINRRRKENGVADALKRAEVWLRKLADDDINQNPKFQQFVKLIESHNDSVKARKWLSAHDEIEAAFSQFVEITNFIMTKAKKDFDLRDKREKPMYELLEDYKAPLKQIVKSAQSISDGATGMINTIDRALER